MMEIAPGLRHSPQEIAPPQIISQINESIGFANEALRHAHLLRKSGDHHLALALLRKISSTQPDDYETLTLMAEILSETGKRKEALLARKVLKEFHPDFTTFYKFAEELYQSGQHDEEALKAYFECLSVMEDSSPQVFEIYKNMGNISVKLADFDGAEEFYNKAYTLNSQSDVLLINFGTLEVQRGDFDKALFCFRQAIQVNEKNDKAWVGLALMHSEYGDHDLATANLITALDLQPMNRTAVLLCAKWAFRDSKETSAIPVLEHFLSIENFDEEMSLILIQLYICQNEFAKAQMEVTKILAWNPDFKAVREIEKQLRSLDRALGEVA